MAGADRPFDRPIDRPLRRGWTTGACATAAARAAWAALVGGAFPDPVEIGLPGGARVAFALALSEAGPGYARAGIVKDAGDDPDVTHGALIVATVRRGPAASGVTFKAGEGVGTVTRPGLALAPGEPAINPVPRAMMRAAIAEIGGDDVEIEISVPGGQAMARQTMNPRLGIVGGISILGTTGIVVPFSCSAWIHSIHRGIDVARAGGVGHVAGATGSTSEAAIRALHGLPEIALIDMGDFVGGMLKYLRARPVARISVAGGVAKMTKLAQGRLDLHSRRGEADLDGLARLALSHGGSAGLGRRIATANTVAQAFGHAAAEGVALGDAVAARAWQVAAAVLAGSGSELETVLFNREARLVGRAGFAHVPSRPLKRR